jgi:hypothetical protein
MCSKGGLGIREKSLVFILSDDAGKQTHSTPFLSAYVHKIGIKIRTI